MAKKKLKINPLDPEFSIFISEFWVWVQEWEKKNKVRIDMSIQIDNIRPAKSDDKLWLKTDNRQWWIQE